MNNEHSSSPEQLSADSSDSDTAPLGDEQDEGREEHSARISFDEDKVVASRVVDPSSSPDAQASSFAGDAERAEPESTKPVDKGEGMGLTTQAPESFEPVAEVKTSIIISSVSLSGDAAAFSAPAPPLDDVVAATVGNASSSSGGDVNGNEAISVPVPSSSSSFLSLVFSIIQCFRTHCLLL